MKKRTFLAIGGIGLIAAGFVAPLALAQTFSGNAVYKVMRSNGTPQVIVANRTPGERLTVTYPGATSTRRVTANACGLVVLRDSTTSPLSSLQTVDGATINQATLPTQLLPRCVNGALEEARTANFKTGTGEVVIVKTPNTVYEAVYGGGRERSVTANACGFAAINESTTYPWASNPTIMIGGTTHTLATMPDAGSEPLCRSGQLYTPAAWP
ncbi:hypothetical protein GFS31_08500 [Leptolyngbya sp. BL0902]|uniref:hypothetical protein n=1 Tax=Leptolyngbya sp. BL0902 TaxID=1115757 RepID=UPI0018E8BC65|nr:hypothetical protein [Leptolyngbya sp. BL0902]QQE64171.1 hypothetical protein GFS31_08500 [Leptolyngbya sp. BL0902]